MRKWFLLGVGLALVIMWAQVPAKAEEVVIRGLITNWYQLKGKVPEQAYFQVVKKEHQIKSGTDEAGLEALQSDLPKIPVRKSGGFQIKLDQMPPGEYFIALQRGFTSAPIVVKDGNPLMFKVPGRFPLNVGNVQLELPLGQETRKAHMIVVE